MFFRLLPSALCVMASCFAASAAQAAIVTITYNGFVDDTSVNKYVDSAGVFGTPGAALAGKAYTAVYKFDTSLGNVSSRPTSNIAIGGTDYSVASPNLSASLTINGHTVSFAGLSHGEIYGSTSSLQHLAEYEDGLGDVLHLDHQTFGPGLPVAIDQPYTFYFPSGTQNDSAFLYHPNADVYLTGVLDPVSVTESAAAIAAVPEPSTWAMLLLGFGGVGFVVYRRRDRPALTVA